MKNKLIHDQELNRQIISMISLTMKSIKGNYLDYYRTKEAEAAAVKCLATMNTAAVELERDNKDLV